MPPDRYGVSIVIDLEGNEPTCWKKGSVLAVVMFGEKNLVRPRNGVIETTCAAPLVTGFLVSDSAHVLPGHTTKLLIQLVQASATAFEVPVLYNSCKIHVLKYVSLLVCLTCAAS